MVAVKDSSNPIDSVLQQGARRSQYLYLYANKDKPLGPATQILADLLIEHSMAG